MSSMNSYDLSRGFINFAFDNPEKISPNHYAIYFFAIEHCNRLGWKCKFGLPTMMVCDAVGIKKPQTFIKYFNDLNYLVFVATNQAGIAKGKYTEEDMSKFHNAMKQSLFNSGAHIDKFYYCPYHSDGIIDFYKLDSEDRKPNTGMLKKITKDWNLSKKHMTMVGDRKTDIECAENFNIHGILYCKNTNLFDLKTKIEKSI